MSTEPVMLVYSKVFMVKQKQQLTPSIFSLWVLIHCPKNSLEYYKPKTEVIGVILLEPVPECQP